MAKLDTGQRIFFVKFPYGGHNGQCIGHGKEVFSFIANYKEGPSMYVPEVYELEGLKFFKMNKSSWYELALRLNTVSKSVKDKIKKKYSK